MISRCGKSLSLFFVSLLAVVSVTSYGSRCFLSFSCICRRFACAVALIVVVAVLKLVFVDTMLAHDFGGSWMAALISLISCSRLARFNAAFISLRSRSMLSSRVDSGSFSGTASRRE